MRLRTLRGVEDRGLRERILQTLASHGYGGGFNPSPSLHRGVLSLTIRARPVGAATGFHGLLLRETGEGFELLDLTEHVAGLGIAPVADPKLCILGDDQFVTFNSGHSSESDNAVHLMRVSPDLGPPQRCDLLGGRQRVEKNWAFGLEDGGLVGMYDLATLTTLRLVRGELATEAPLQLERAHVGRRDARRALTIGTQLVPHGSAHLAIAHEKRSIGGKRAYAGRLVQLDDLWSTSPSARVSPRRLIHSVRDALPRRGVHNPNLLSATYFAGLTACEDGLIVGYGINDVDFAIGRVEHEELW